MTPEHLQLCLAELRDDVCEVLFDELKGLFHEIVIVSPSRLRRSCEWRVLLMSADEKTWEFVSPIRFDILTSVLKAIPDIRGTILADRQTREAKQKCQ